MPSPNTPQELASFEFVVDIPERMEEHIWRQRSSWEREVIHKLEEEELRPKFGNVVSAKFTRVGRGSLVGTITLLGLITAIAQYKDLIDSISLIRDHLAQAIEHIFGITLRQSVPRSVPHTNIQVHVTNVYFPENVISLYKESPWEETEGDVSEGVSSPGQQAGGNNKDNWAALFVGIVIGIIIAGVIASREPNPEITNILQPVQSYYFESAPPQNFRLTGNPINNSSLAEPGFRGKRSLRLNLALAPYVSEIDQGGFSFELPTPLQAQAFSAHILLPENEQSLTDHPIYAQFITESIQRGPIPSPTVQLKPGHWVPLFWSLSSDSWDKLEITRLQLRVFRYNLPYNGPVYIDDLVIYDLTEAQKAISTPTPSP